MRKKLGNELPEGDQAERLARNTLAPEIRLRRGPCGSQGERVVQVAPRRPGLVFIDGLIGVVPLAADEDLTRFCRPRFRL
jgi:hypothetical protein